jgi:hypothetical protein
MMGPVREKAEAVLCRVDGKKTGFLFLEHVVVSPDGQEMGAEFGGLGQDLDDPLQLRGGNADLIRRAAALAIGATGVVLDDRRLVYLRCCALLRCFCQRFLAQSCKPRSPDGDDDVPHTGCTILRTFLRQIRTIRTLFIADGSRKGG